MCEAFAEAQQLTLLHWNVTPPPPPLEEQAPALLQLVDRDEEAAQVVHEAAELGDEEAALLQGQAAQLVEHGRRSEMEERDRQGGPLLEKRVQDLEEEVRAFRSTLEQLLERIGERVGIQTG